MLIYPLISVVSNMLLIVDYVFVLFFVVPKTKSIFEPVLCTSYYIF